jgi:hypothetical protein
VDKLQKKKKCLEAAENVAFRNKAHISKSILSEFTVGRKV